MVFFVQPLRGVVVIGPIGFLRVQVGTTLPLDHDIALCAEMGVVNYLVAVCRRSFNCALIRLLLQLQDEVVLANWMGPIVASFR